MNHARHKKQRRNQKDKHTSSENPFSFVRNLFMKPLRMMLTPSAVSRLKTSYRLTMGAEVNTRIAFLWQKAKQNKFHFGVNQ